ncbi:MAG: hypothetical protein PXX73_04290 [Sideroxydans sp.]|nr:hypothetical protein [Sideroxydans sp.]
MSVLEVPDHLKDLHEKLMQHCFACAGVGLDPTPFLDNFKPLFIEIQSRHNLLLEWQKFGNEQKAAALDLQANLDLALKNNNSWVEHGKSQDLRISELCGRVNSLNTENSALQKDVSKWKKQAIFSSLMVVMGLIPQITKLLF